jgi:predicted RNA-binding Zn ribbon-like protein
VKVKDNSAPGTLDVLRQFVNTLDVADRDKDELASASLAREWLQAHGLLAETAGPLGDADLELVRGLREALRIEFLSHAGEADAQHAWTALREFAGLADLGVSWGEQRGEIALVAQAAGAKQVAGRCFALIYDAIRDGRWQRLKACRKETCLWAFYDHSKNGSGHWCSMAVCGNRVKAQRRRAREAT